MEQTPSPHHLAPPVSPALSPPISTAVIPPPTLYEAAAQVVAAFPPARPRARIDGWSPARQRAFCEALADCGMVRDAAAAVGMSPQSAYELKRRPEGKGFALGWAAALLLARPRLVDLAMERAVDGNTDHYIKDGELVGERRKQDVRHLLAAITKLENGQTGDAVIAAVADDFDEFLDCMEAEAQAVNAPAAILSTPCQPTEEGKVKGKRKPKPKPTPSPIRVFFEDRDCGPGLDGHEFDAVMNRFSHIKTLPVRNDARSSHEKPKKKSDSDDDIWSDWDRDPFVL